MNEAVRSGGLLGFYARYVLPRLIDLAMRNKDARGCVLPGFPQAGGEVLEIGIGSGLKSNSRLLTKGLVESSAAQMAAIPRARNACIGAL